jgi:hypothetical protein
MNQIYYFTWLDEFFSQGAICSLRVSVNNSNYRGLLNIDTTVEYKYFRE